MDGHTIDWGWLTTIPPQNEKGNGAIPTICLIRQIWRKEKAPSVYNLLAHVYCFNGFSKKALLPCQGIQNDRVAAGLTKQLALSG
jgi:hypothetical protein